MNKKLLCTLSFLSLTALTLGVALTFVNRRVEKADAYSVSSLPTTIDLNDTSAANIRSYYSSLNNLSQSERQGTNLLKNLKTILKNGQKYHSYDSNSNIWQIYEITDRDWEKSPASSTTYGTYNSSTNKITNYTYGSSSSNSKNNPYIHALYINRDVTNQTTAWDNHNQDQWGINREHVWPKAEGFETSGAGGARGDPMHLMAGNGYANNIHSNYYYGYVKTSTSYTDCGSKYSNQSGNLRGTSLTLNSGTVFEPQDCDKGDIARAIFYMVARYNYLSGSDSDGIDSNNPNLTLTQNISDWASSGYSSTTSNPGKMGILTDLLAWHHSDPVDEFEIHRNNLLYTNYTNNRNPFIDFPEWVDFIWGTATYNGKNYQSYSSTPTGYATPSSDTINGYNDVPSTPTVNYVSVSPTSLNLNLDDETTGQLHVTVNVSNGAAQTVTWTSSNTSVATVSSSGLVTAKAVGTSTVTVRSTVDNTKYATCTVTVTESGQQGGGDGEYVDATMGAGTNSTSATVNTKSAYKVGTGSNGGSMTITVPAGATSLKFYAAAWNGVTGLSINISGATTSPSSVALTADSGIANSTPFTLSGNEENYKFTVELSGITTTTTLTFTSSINKRFVLWNPQYSTGSSSPAEPTSIIATVSKDFKVGETITKSDITLKDDLDNVITDFVFEDYQFTYEDAESGGADTEKDFDLTYNDMETILTVSVSREAYQTPGTTKTTMTSSAVFNAIGGSNSSKVDGTVSNDGITYEYHQAYYYGSASSLSFGKGDAVTGYLTNKTPLSKALANVVLTDSSNNDYNLRFSDDGTDDSWVLSTDADVSGNNYKYFKIDYDGLNVGSYTNISKIEIYLKDDTATNVSNYIMFEDTNNQCVQKLDIAVDYLNNMSTSEKTLFNSSDDYVISQARTRLNAWAANQGKSISYSNGGFAINGSNLIINVSHNNNILLIVLISGFVSLTSLGLFFFYKKKHQ